MEKRDVLWKGIIEDFFNEFLEYFFPKYIKQIDFEAGYEFLDKELQKISPQSKESRRFVDLLAKVYLKNGKENWILIHIEVQGYPDTNFENRMFIYQYRIYDRFQIHPAALAIFSDDDLNFHPKKYSQSIFGTKIQYQFPTYKLSDKKLEEFENFQNPFSIIMETAWWGLKKNKLTQKQLFSKKIHLYRKLLLLGFSGEKIHHLLSFIKYYTPFDKSEINIKFEEEISIISKNTDNMGIQERLLQAFKDDGILEGMAEGEAKGKAEGMAEGKAEGMAEGKAKGKAEGIGLSLKIIDLLKEGKSVHQISKQLEIEKNEVLKIKSHLGL